MAALLAAVFCLSLCACSHPEAETRDVLSLWYTADSPLATSVERLAAEYNATLSGDLPELSLRAFADEEALSAAFEITRPDLLLCSHLRAFELYGRGALRSPDAGPAYSEALRLYSPCVGESYFPLGFLAPLLYAREDALGESGPEDLQALLSLAGDYGRENRVPFLTADSFSALLYDMMLCLGSELHGLRAKDLSNRDYGTAYNLLAGAAYWDGLTATDHPAAALVQSGYLPCAVVSSPALLGAEQEGYQILPLPRLRGGTYLAMAEGLAVTAPEGRSLRGAAAFLTWLAENGRISSLALEAGLVPAADVGAEAADPLSAALVRMARSWEAHLPVPGCDWLQNREALEESLRQAIELLN